jgi:hypothetical protein
MAKKNLLIAVLSKHVFAHMQWSFVKSRVYRLYTRTLAASKNVHAYTHRTLTLIPVPPVASASSSLFIAKRLLACFPTLSLQDDSPDDRFQQVSCEGRLA